MKRRLQIVVAALVGLSLVCDWPAASAQAEEPKLLELSGDLGVHDPVMIKDGSTYYVFYTGGARGAGGGRGRGRRGGRGGGNNANATGQAGGDQATQPAATPTTAEQSATTGGQPAAAQSAATQSTTTPSAAEAAQAAAGQPTTDQPAAAQPAAPAPTGSINMLTSPDMKTWTRAGFALDRLPDWTRAEFPNRRNQNDVWAPDIAYFKGKYYLYYSISSFGSQESAIGLATNKTLDPKSPDFKWEDGGMVLRSHDGDPYNAIDPNLIVEDENNVWLSWGSFWGGLMMRRVDPATGRLSEMDTTLHNLAKRERGTAIEAPFTIRHGNHWYLFVSWDRCCRGPESTYKVAVGRAEKITGPYLDKEGKDMAAGGGTLILDPQTDNWHGAGHNGYFRENGNDYLVFHAYRATGGRGGGSQLHISTVVWEDGWPKVATMP